MSGESVADVLAEHSRCGYLPALGEYECGIRVERGERMWALHYEAALLPVINAAKAQAWDEGEYSDGFVSNPYREARRGGDQ